MTVTVTLLFANAAAAAAALARIDSEVATPLPKIEAAEAQAPKPAKAAATPPAANTPPSAGTSKADAPAPEEFKYETLKSAALPLIPKLGAAPFNEIASTFGFASLRDLGANGTPAQWAEAYAKVQALASGA
jgi:hypothetical protein